MPAAAASTPRRSDILIPSASSRISPSAFMNPSCASPARRQSEYALSRTAPPGAGKGSLSENASGATACSSAEAYCVETPEIVIREKPSSGSISTRKSSASPSPTVHGRNRTRLRSSVARKSIPAFSAARKIRSIYATPGSTRSPRTRWWFRSGFWAVSRSFIPSTPKNLRLCHSPRRRPAREQQP